MDGNLLALVEKETYHRVIMNWAIPILKRWSNLWYYIGIGGTVILIALFVIAVPGRGLQVSAFEITIELVQIVFIISSIMIIRERTIKTKLASARKP